MSNKNQLGEMLTEHEMWQQKILSYRDELEQFNNILGKIVKLNPDSDKLRKIEHFQNQFILQNENLDIMRHDFKQHENSIEALQNEVSADPEIKINQQHEDQKVRLTDFEKIFGDLKKEFEFFQST
ncbi:MAG TPA: hypothetical protein PKH65_07050 [Bacteroidia bacterium]|nr:hypothetical protein [Bacteroidia bacterium]HNT80424.1 hypothetical protein [Bacteroidia bacterium]